MKEFRVYTEISVLKNGLPVTLACMIFGVFAESAGGAEHKLLDDSPRVGNEPIIKNALAFSADDRGEYFMNCLQCAKVYDLRDFMTRCKSMAEYRKSQFSDLYEELTAAQKEVKKAYAAYTAAKHNYDIAIMTEKAVREDIADLEKLYNTRCDFDTVQGIA